ncbi:hypothetical protein ACNRWW_03280 [Metabacillus sp. HB246100]
MNRTFYALLVSQTSNLGFELYTMVVILHLFDKTDSAILAATVTLVSVVFRMISTVFLPIISDKFKPPKLLMYSQMSQFILFNVFFGLFHQEINTINISIIFNLLGFISFFN